MKALKMKALKIIAPVLALGLSFTAIANAKDTLPVRSAKQLTNTVRQVTYIVAPQVVSPQATRFK